MRARASMSPPPSSLASQHSYHSERSRYSVKPEIVSLSTPLGHSVSRHDHYIEPRPPRWETEYEAAFKWPPPSCYTPPASPKRRSSRPTATETRRAWHDLEEAARALSEQGVLGRDRDEEHGRQLQSALRERRLDPVLEALHSAAAELAKEPSTETAVRLRCRSLLEAVAAIKGSKPKPTVA